jgi:anti-sigma B factor antagonist
VHGQQRARGQSRPVVVVMPPEIDIADSGFLGEQLASALASGASKVIADLTVTRFCDCSGIRMLARTYMDALRQGVELQLVLPAGPILRILSLMELDRWLPICPDLATAHRIRPVPHP